MIVFENDTFLKGKKSVRFGFFGRRGGVSKGIYSSLNCGSGSKDDPDMVAENRRRAANHLGGDTGSLVSLQQVHSADCVEITAPPDRPPKADALVTDRPGLALSVLTADCAPVLFYGEKADGAPVIGAAHAGWKGALNGILPSTLRSMRALGAEPETVRACVGPCIAQASYEVSRGSKPLFWRNRAKTSGFLKPARRTRICCSTCRAISPAFWPFPERAMSALWG